MAILLDMSFIGGELQKKKERYVGNQEKKQYFCITKSHKPISKSVKQKFKHVETV
jgi:hypothetical protein